MKHFLLLILILFGSPSFSQYCNSNSTLAAFCSTSGVFLNTISNTTSGCNTYSDFSFLNTELIINQNYQLTIELENCQGFTAPKTSKVYIDWNADTIFQSSETVLDINATLPPNVNLNSFSANITVPSFAVKESDLDRWSECWIFGLQDDISDIMEVHVVGVDSQWKIMNMQGTEEDPRFSVNFFAGSQAMAQASIMGFDEVCLVGFDSIWNFQDDTYQNIYAGTNAYEREKETSRLRVGTDDPNSLLGTQEAQIKKVIDRFEDVNYTIYNSGLIKPLTYDSFI